MDRRNFFKSAVAVSAGTLVAPAMIAKVLQEQPPPPFHLIALDQCV